MQIQRAFKVRIYPTDEQRVLNKTLLFEGKEDYTGVPKKSEKVETLALKGMSQALRLGTSVMDMDYVSV